LPEVTYSTVINAPIETIWDFVKDMNNWAPFVTGYQEHEVIDDADSIWTLNGDVGVMTRKAKFRMHVTEWAGPTRVTFTMIGLTEQVQGGGIFLMAPAGAPQEIVVLEASGLRRLRNRIFRLIFRLFNPGSSKREALASGAADRGQSSGTQLTFRLKLTSGGMVGPVVDAMIEPMLLPAAEDLANKIADRVEAMQAGG